MWGIATVGGVMNLLQIRQLASEEEFRVVQSLFLSPPERKRSVTFAAPDRNGGCSWVTARTAARLAAHTTASVCVVDANLRWPALHNLFHAEPCPGCGRKNHDRGLLQALTSPGPIRQFVRPTEISNLWLLPAGGALLDTHRLLISKSVKNRFAELAQEFDFVLVDTPAMKSSVDASLVARFTDGAVLVVAAGETRKNNAEDAKRAFETANIPILGAVLNKRTYPIPDALYGYL
jgi:capsular exopolysaccharide synthesis family protein